MARLPEGSTLANVLTLTDDGQGVANVNGRRTLIAGALPGEVVEFRYLRRHRHGDEGVVTGVIQAAPDRVEPRCPYTERCGGCRLQHLAHPAQLQGGQSAHGQPSATVGKFAATKNRPKYRFFVVLLSCWVTPPGEESEVTHPQNCKLTRRPSRGPSISINNTDCQVPNKSFSWEIGIVTDPGNNKPVKWAWAFLRSSTVSLLW